MTRRPDADKMHEALRQIVVPYLRQQGFRGAFPHFRRPGGTRIDLLSFQFGIQSSGGFYISLASSPLDGIVDSSGSRVPPSKVNAYHGVFNGTFRRLSPTDPYDHEFIYRPDPKLQAVYENSPQIVSVYYGEGDGKYERIALDVLILIQKRADDAFKTLSPASRARTTETESPNGG